MSDITFTATDNAPPINGTILDSDNVPVNLTGATVRFQMRLKNDRRFTVDGAASVVSATAGTVRYDWADTDLLAPGEYQSQWRVQYSGGDVQTTDPPSTITIRSD